MENNIPTAEEWLLNHKELSIYHVEEYDEGGYLGVNEEALYKIMIEFAKLHCEAQREAIKKELEEGLETHGISLTDDFKFEQTGNCLIDNTYPLTNIK